MFDHLFLPHRRWTARLTTLAEEKVIDSWVGGPLDDHEPPRWRGKT